MLSRAIWKHLGIDRVSIDLSASPSASGPTAAPPVWAPTGTRNRICPGKHEPAVSGGNLLLPCGGTLHARQLRPLFTGARPRGAIDAPRLFARHFAQCPVWPNSWSSDASVPTTAAAVIAPARRWPSVVGASGTSFWPDARPGRRRLVAGAWLLRCDDAEPRRRRTGRCGRDRRALDRAWSSPRGYRLGSHDRDAARVGSARISGRDTLGARRQRASAWAIPPSRVGARRRAQSGRGRPRTAAPACLAVTEHRPRGRTRPDR